MQCGSQGPFSFFPIKRKEPRFLYNNGIKQRNRTDIFCNGLGNEEFGRLTVSGSNLFPFAASPAAGFSASASKLPITLRTNGKKDIRLRPAATAGNRGLSQKLVTFSTSPKKAATT